MFSIANNVATYFGVVPGTFAGADPVLAALNVMGTATWTA
jgi:high-affinity K+ transport system ATPase subunit B